MRSMLLCALLALGSACSTSTSTGPVPSVELPDWIEDLPPEARPVVSDGYASIMACGSEVGGDPQGEVSIMLGIGNGKVKTFGLLRNETGKRELVECVQDKARKLRFQKGFRTDLTLRFEFGAQP